MEIPEGFDNDKHFLISIRVVLLSMAKLITKMCYRMEACLHGSFLQKYGTKDFAISIYVYLMLGVVGIIKHL